MKKIIILLLVAFCLLCFMEISCFAEGPLPVLNGEFWNGLTKLEGSLAIKGAYIRGVKDGIEKGIECMGKLPLDKDKDGTTAFLLLLDFLVIISEAPKAVVTVMDDLYKDPANTYIPLCSMCEIASMKLKSEDEEWMEYIESLLKEAREKALR